MPQRKGSRLVGLFSTLFRDVGRRERDYPAPTPAISPLGRKALAPFTAASSQNRSSGASTHAQTKTMNLRTATVVGLERALTHGIYSLNLIRSCRDIYSRIRDTTGYGPK